MNLRINISGGIHTLTNLDCNLKPRFRTSFMYKIRHDNEAFKDMRPYENLQGGSASTFRHQNCGFSFESVCE